MKKYLQMSSAALLIGTLRVKANEYTFKGSYSATFSLVPFLRDGMGVPFLRDGVGGGNGLEW